MGKAGSGKLYPLLLQLLKENSRLAGGAAGVTADAATPLPAQVRCLTQRCVIPLSCSELTAGVSADIPPALPAHMPCPALQLATL